MVRATRKTADNGNSKNVGIAVLFRYLSNRWRTLEMLLTNSEINLILI